MALKQVYDLIWDERWWFPKNISGHKYGWHDLENQAGSKIYLPQIWDMHWSLALGMALVFVRYILDRYVKLIYNLASIALISYPCKLPFRYPSFLQIPHVHLANNSIYYFISFMLFFGGRYHQRILFYNSFTTDISKHVLMNFRAMKNNVIHNMVYTYTKHKIYVS